MNAEIRGFEISGAHISNIKSTKGLRQVKKNKKNAGEAALQKPFGSPAAALAFLAAAIGIFLILRVDRRVVLAFEQGSLIRAATRPMYQSRRRLG